jgi:predicted aspartyl protease
VEINSYVVERFVDTGASMSVMAVIVVRELGIMHLVAGFGLTKPRQESLHRLLVELMRYQSRLEVYSVP